MTDEISVKETVNPLAITDKGKCKWKGEFKSLQKFVEEVLEIKGKWTSPGGGSKQIKTEDISIRWYEQNQTITLSGSKAEECRRCLEHLAKISIENTDVSEGNQSPLNLSRTEDEDGQDQTVIMIGSKSKGAEEYSKSFEGETEVSSVNTNTLNGNGTLNLNLFEDEDGLGQTPSLLNTNELSHSNPVDVNVDQTRDQTSCCVLKETVGSPVKFPFDNTVTDASKEDESSLNLSVNEGEIERMHSFLNNRHSLENTVDVIQNQLYSLKCEFEKHRTEYSKVINDLVNKHDNSSTSINKPQFDKLYRENQLLKDENKALNERLDNLGFILADLNSKVKHAEEEKASLITTIRLLQQDANEWNVVKSKKDDYPIKNAEFKARDKSTPHLRDGLGVGSRFSVLDDEVEGSKDELSIKNPPKSKSQTTKLKKNQKNQTTTSRSKKDETARVKVKGQTDEKTTKRTFNNATPTTVILGDSMIRRIQGWRLGRKVGHRVVVKPFSGATTTDMRDHMKPSLRRKPERVILHIGTNDLKGSSPVEIADNIVDLARMIENESDAEIVLSEIITRADNIPDENVKKINKLVNRYANQNGWGIIRNDNITKHHLDEKGLHLNEKGISIMINNLVTYFSK